MSEQENIAPETEVAADNECSKEKVEGDKEESDTSSEKVSACM